MAEGFSAFSFDSRRKVGCVIVTEEGILYPGYNGDECGGSNKPDSLEPGHSNFIHAEANALIKFNPTIHKSCYMFVTSSPCPVCARMIVNCKSIKEVLYKELYRDSSGIDILLRAGISVNQLND